VKLGRVVIDLGYVVDIENPDMVERAKDAIFEDMMNAVKYDEVYNNIDIVDDPEANECDIPDFLKDLDEEEDDDYVG